MNIKKRHTVGLLLSTLFLTSCPGGDGDKDSTVSKLSQCQELWGAYCDSANSFGCEGASSCSSDKNASCKATFDGTCGASAEEQEMVDHDIEMIIGSKTDCDGLESIESYEQDKIDEMKSAGCSSGAPSSDGDVDADADSDADADTDADTDADADGEKIYPDLNITSTCQACVQTECPSMQTTFDANPNATTFVNQVCDCACEASNAFLPLFTCIVLSAEQNNTEVQTAGADLASCISGSGAPCASACHNFGCECDPGEAVNDCNFCIAEACVAETLTCFDNLYCLALMDCVSACDTDACIDTCGENYPYGVDDFVTMFTCITQGCATECQLAK